MYDAALDARVQADIVRHRRRRSLFAALSLVVIVGQLGLGVAMLGTTLHSPEEGAYGTQAIVLSALSTFLITLDVTLGIRERAAAHHAALYGLLGIRAQLRHPNASPLWADYATIRAHTKINYIDAVADACCAWPVAAPTSLGVAAATPVAVMSVAPGAVSRA